MRTLGFLILWVAVLPGSALALTCPGGIVSLGQSLAEVHMRCGDPTYWDQRIDETDLHTQEGLWLHRSKTIDEWTYDLGTTRLVQTLRFVDSTLVKITSGGYGKGAANPSGDRPGILSVGDSKAKVILTWGQPAYADQRVEDRTWFGERGEQLHKSVTVDMFTYDFGPHRLIRMVKLENSRVVEIRTGDYGRQPDPPGAPAASEADDQDQE